MAIDRPRFLATGTAGLAGIPDVTLTSPADPRFAAAISTFRVMPISIRRAGTAIAVAVASFWLPGPAVLAADAPSRPNVVLMFPDNLGVGEVSAYGGARGVPTPNIDRIAAEGIRLTNFNVEYSCVVSRIALLTGRYAVRTGDGWRSGMTLWEVTIAEALGSLGYATALYGKWHVGGDDWEGRREPTQQGFDEWWGIPGTSHTAQFSTFDGFDAERYGVPSIWEGRAGEPSRPVAPYDTDTRRTIDRRAALRGIEFMQRNVRRDRPFFLFYPMTQVHFPALPHPDFAGTTGAGDIGDAMADVDHNVGLVLDAIDELGIADDTLVFWCTDNGAEMRRPWRGSAGPWRGYYNSAMEGGIRTPCVIRWPGRIPAGRVSNEIVHEVDLLPTIAAAAGAPGIVPDDRPIDGVDQLAFLEARQARSNRASALFVARAGDVMAVKWHDWKLWYAYRTEMPNLDPGNRLRLFDLRVDPREEIDVADFYPWVISAMDGLVADYEASLARHPRIPPGAEDPWIPPPPGSGDPVAAYARTDRGTLPPRGEALPGPDFSGAWSTTPVSSAPPTGGPVPAPVPDLGSGWGNDIAIRHDDRLLQVERIFFLPREVQPPVRYRYALDGRPTENTVNLGRSRPPTVSTTAWDGNRLVITTRHPFVDPATGRADTQFVTRTLWLQPAGGTPFEPSLVVETLRAGVLGGADSTTRTVYNRGYR